MAVKAKKQDVEAWVQALERYDQGNFKASIETFAHAGETSKASFNIGIIHATLGEHDEAVREQSITLLRQAWIIPKYHWSSELA
ncbi:hypothetical protein TWF679_010090 [Orbilia oligospora]|uniref:Uncharacterized protein n=1 Tax=Orbilia oligospora TaxID=2813651 RepID=A0A8H8V118_ORBOL|nr:hypothetical protein TWF679_010090 [Orbilia oligospora]